MVIICVTLYSLFISKYVWTTWKLRTQGSDYARIRYRTGRMEAVLVPNFFEDGEQLRVKELSYDSEQRIR